MILFGNVSYIAEKRKCHVDKLHRLEKRKKKKKKVSKKRKENSETVLELSQLYAATYENLRFHRLPLGFCSVCVEKVTYLLKKAKLSSVE